MDLKKRRLKAGLSLPALASLTGLSVGKIWNDENGGKITAQQLKIYATIYHISVRALKR